jgi:hypothetical protein
MAKRKGPPVSHLKVMIWDAKVDTYISSEMLADKAGCGELRGNQIVINPNIQSLHELLDTFIHEILHISLDKYHSIEEDEELVQHCTEKVFKSLTGFERVRLFLKLAQSLKHVEKGEYAESTDSSNEEGRDNQIKQE